MVNRLVDAQESVVRFVELLNLDGRVLCVVFLEIKRQLARDILCQYGSLHAFLALVQHRQHAVINIIINQYDSFLRSTNQVIHKRICVKNLSIEENMPSCGGSDVRTKKSIFSSVLATLCSKRSNLLFTA